MSSATQRRQRRVRNFKNSYEFTPSECKAGGVMSPARILNRALSVDRCLCVEGKASGDLFCEALPPVGEGWEWWGWCLESNFTWGITYSRYTILVFFRHGEAWLSPHAGDPVDNGLNWKLKPSLMASVSMLAGSYPIAQHPVLDWFRDEVSQPMPSMALVWLQGIPPVRAIHNVKEPLKLSKLVGECDIVTNRYLSEEGHSAEVITTYKSPRKITNPIEQLCEVRPPTMTHPLDISDKFVLSPGTDSSPLWQNLAPVMGGSISTSRLDKVLHQFVAHALLAAFAVPGNKRHDKRLKRVATWVKQVRSGKA